MSLRQVVNDVPVEHVVQVGEEWGECCYGAVINGRCTCWEPVYDQDQAEPDTSTEPTTRAKCCHDCAYRQGSPEREAEGFESPVDLAGEANRVFWCHQGMRKIVAWRHPDGREKSAGLGDDYSPPILEGTPYLADGHAGERCAGWAALHASLTAGEGE